MICVCVFPPGIYSVGNGKHPLAGGCPVQVFHHQNWSGAVGAGPEDFCLGFPAFLRDPSPFQQVFCNKVLVHHIYKPKHWVKGRNVGKKQIFKKRLLCWLSSQRHIALGLFWNLSISLFFCTIVNTWSGFFPTSMKSESDSQGLCVAVPTNSAEKARYKTVVTVRICYFTISNWKYTVLRRGK